MDLNDIVSIAAVALGVNPVTAVAAIGVVVAAGNLLGRAIPDDKKGVLGFVRKIAKVIGMYTPNRVASGVTMNDVAKTVLHDHEAKVGDMLDLAMQAATNQPVPPFPDHPIRDPATGRFQPKSGS